jgi:hypothetical protein
MLFVQLRIAARSISSTFWPAPMPTMASRPRRPDRLHVFPEVGRADELEEITSAPRPPVRSGAELDPAVCVDRGRAQLSIAYRHSAWPGAPITIAPEATPICTAAEPTPPAAPCTSSVSPGRTGCR